MGRKSGTNGARRPGLLAKLLLLGASTLLVLACAELVMRRVVCRQTHIDSFAEVRERWLGNPIAIFPKRARAYEELVPDTNVGPFIHVNALGFRGRDVSPAAAAGVRRLVALGGSSVFGTASSNDRTTWPAQLEVLISTRGDLAPTEVLNGGVPGFTVEQSVARLEKLFLPLDVDVAVLCNMHNDVCDSRRERLGFDSRFEASVPVTGRLERLLSHSAIWLRIQSLRGASRKAERLRTAAEAEARANAPRGEAGLELRDPALGAELVERRAAALEREESAPVDYNRYLIPSDLAAYRQTLGQFVRLARENGVEPVLCTQAFSFRLDSDSDTYPEGVEIANVFPDFAMLRATLAAYNGVVREVARAEGACLFDAEAWLGGRRKLFNDHVHLTDEGCHVFAEGLLELLSREGLLRP